MSGQYGYFDEPSREYVITRPDTPVPWFNYIHHDQYCGMVSHVGGGTSFWRDARHMRLLRYRFNGLPADRPGRYLYIRDDQDGHYWSATWAPVCTALDGFEFQCRVGLGYQSITTRYRGIETVIIYLAPGRAPCELWWLRLTNRGRSVRRISTFSYAEFCMWSALRDWTNMDSPPHTVRIGRTSDNVILHSSYTDLGTELAKMQFVRFYGYLACSGRPVGYEINREDFIGRGRSEANPLVVEAGRNQPRKLPTGNPLGSFRHRWRLRAGQSIELCHILGMSLRPSGYVGVVGRYRRLVNVGAAFERLKLRWQKQLSTIQARTPQRGFNVIFNTFAPYQATMTFHLSRSLAPYCTGIARGVGYRDTSQDCLGVIGSLSQAVRGKLVLLMENQFANGTARHNFFPLTGEAEGASAFFDDHLWFIQTINRYVKETGEVDFLSERVAFADGGSGSVLEHINRALSAAWRLRGRRGLCLTGKADWNDGLNPPPGTESPFTSMLFCRSALEAAELADQIGQHRRARLWRAWYRQMKQRINRVAWDGAWYRRQLLPDGGLVGSRSCRQGKIFLEPQVWSVLSGVASAARARQAMESVRRYLARPYGIKLQHPPYRDYDPSIGSVGIFRPGLKENGAVFCHTNPWAIIAECMLGHGDRAYDYFRRISPYEKNKMIEVYENEPYVFSQHVAAEPHPRAGRARNSWLTGTASWAYVAMSQYILGVR
ncbi:MAG: GH36-type glycosyl hydrolase domain-containing protein, partial [Phycisphaerae bacterium]